MSQALASLDPTDVAAAVQIIEHGLIEGRKILLLGNGGSCATASHLATDLKLLARDARLCACVNALHDNANLVTAIANDYGFAESGAALVETTVSRGDVLLIFSCSGRSPNLVSAAHAAVRLGGHIVLVGSILAPLDFPASHRILVDSDKYSIIEVAHIAVAHSIVELLRARLGVEMSAWAHGLPSSDERQSV
jgi:D-sedoheptulose 7-phosphate isomerase